MLASDKTSDNRLETYRNCGLISGEIAIPTATNHTGEDEVVSFNPVALSWTSEDAESAALSYYASVYSELTQSDWETAKFVFTDPASWPAIWRSKAAQILPGQWSSVSDGLQDELDYLAAVSKGEIVSDALSAAEATDLRQTFVESWASSATYATYATFTMDATGLDVATSIRGIDRFRNMTPEQFLAVKSASGTTTTTIPLATVVNGSFTGSEDFSGSSLRDVDISGVSGITASQIIASSGYNAKNSLPGINMSTEQYNSFKNDIAASISAGNSVIIRVNGVTTVIEGTGE